jgi:hypothetical protein
MADNSEIMKISYLNAYPGMGKTFYAIRKMAALLRSTDPQSSLIYCAPTIKLLEEVHTDLMSYMDITKHKKVHMITSAADDLEDSRRRQSIVTRIQKIIKNPKMSQGRVLMITHEAFTRLDRMKEFKNFRVYFDEARKVVNETPRIVVRGKGDVRFIQAAMKPSSRSPGYFVVNKEKYLRSIQNIRSDTSLRNYGLLADLGQAIIKSRSEIYIKMRIDPRSNRASLAVYELVLPSSVFRQFKSVTLMASHFDESQMYWILKDDPKIKLIDKSHVLDTRDEDGYLRSERIRWRYSRVHVLPVTPSETPLSKTFLVTDAYIRQDHAHMVLEPELKNLKLRNSRYAGHAIREYFLNPSWAKTKELSRIIRKLSPYVKTNPLKYLENRSREFAHYAKSMFGQKERPLLLINTSMNDEFNMVLRGPNEFWERLPFMNHGLNQYVTRNVIAFLAAIQISNGLKGFLQARIPNYDPDLDHLADVCNQSVCRTAVRNPASLSEVWVIVPDMKTAQLLQSKMMGEPKILDDLYRDPKECYVTVSSVLRAERQRIRGSDSEEGESREQIVRQAELLARRTPEFRDYRKLYVRVKDMRERDPNHPDLKSLTKEMKLLNEARVRRHKRVRELLEEGRSFDALAEKIKNLPGNRERGTRIPTKLKSTPEFKKFRSLRASLNKAIQRGYDSIPRYQKLLEEARTTLYALVDKYEKR